MGRNGQALIAATRLRDVRADRTPGGVACNGGTGGAAGGSSIPLVLHGRVQSRKIV